MTSSKPIVLTLAGLAVASYAAYNAVAQTGAPARAAATASSSSDEAEREKIWNSPEMLRARAWLEEYFRVSKKYTPEQAAEYRTHLREMTARQMEIWLMKFEHDRQTSQQHAAWDEHARSAKVAHDLATLRQSQKTLDEVNQQENQAAQQQEQRIQSQQQEADAMARQREAEQSSALRRMYSGPNLPYNYHYHYHIYP